MSERHFSNTDKIKRAFGIPKALDMTGADFQTRTGDPILTMDVLYLLS